VGEFSAYRGLAAAAITPDFEARETICVGMLECGEAKGCWLQIAMKQKLSGAQYRYVEDEIPN
jgi:hypothetical protein